MHQLTVSDVIQLRQLVRRQAVRTPVRRMANHDLKEWVDFALGIGCRNGEALGIRWINLDLHTAIHTVQACAIVMNREPTR